MNQFTIEFKNSKDLAKKISEYNELMNGAKIQPPEPAPVVVEFKPAKDEPKEEPKPTKDEPKEEKPVLRSIKKSSKTFQSKSKNLKSQ